MGDKLSRVSGVTAALAATVMAGVLAVSTVQPASADPDPAPVTPTPAPTVLKPGSFRVTSFNLLGANHTPKGGKRASGTTRTVWANQLLQRHKVDVAGFQEMQAPQVTKFLAITKGTWAVWPGLQVRKVPPDNSIGWRTAKFDLVHATTVKIPYFNGRLTPMPLVLLRDKKSGMMTYFANFHNPADTKKYHKQAKWRLAASRAQIALHNQLVVRGIPRIMTGDMNERAPYFCRVTAAAPLKAARPQSYRNAKGCFANKPRAVDWIFGSLRVQFTKYVEDRSDLVDKTTDHPVIVATATVDPKKLPNGWATTPPAPFVPKLKY
jgi:hypothetical protein